MTDTPDEDAIAAAYDRALAAEKRGDRDAAGAAWRALLALDPQDRGGAAIRLAALGLAPPPPVAPPAHVALLFDQHAEVFDGMLVDQLGYHAPLELREMLRLRGGWPWGRMLDLGCGTGLTGESLRDMADWIEGVDLSEGMLEIAEEKEVYDALHVGDAAGFLDHVDATWDLITATDVLPYIGALEGLAAGVARRLAPGGLFAFSTETAAPEAFAGRRWMVGPKQRYAHALDYVSETFAAAGAPVAEAEAIVVRHDEGAPIPGHLVIARKP
ncbi:MAG: methyltransferase domain-containing protein [Rhodobacteraceae bacterium]|nr:MAG: methyltransferase domain-containing protein [Paracoccaceae bacterium]